MIVTRLFPPTCECRLLIQSQFHYLLPSLRGGGGGGGAVSQSVERSTPSEEVPGSIPAVVARSLLVGSLSA